MCLLNNKLRYVNWVKYVNLMSVLKISTADCPTLVPKGVLEEVTRMSYWFNLVLRTKYQDNNYQNGVLNEVTRMSKVRSLKK